MKFKDIKFIFVPKDEESIIVAARSRLAELAAAETTSGRRLARATSVWEELTAAAQSFSALADVAAERVRGLTDANHHNLEVMFYSSLHKML